MEKSLIKRIINLLVLMEYYIPDDKYDIISCIRLTIKKLEEEL